MVLYKVSTSGSCMRHCPSLKGPAVLIDVGDSSVDSQTVVVLLQPTEKIKKRGKRRMSRSEWSVLKCVYGDYLSWENSSLMHAVLPAIWI